MPQALRSQLLLAEAQAPFLESYDATHRDANTQQFKHRTRRGYERQLGRFQRKCHVLKSNEKVRDGIISYWSPEQIAGRMVCDKLNKRNRVSRSTIERWIKQHGERKHWESYLRRRGNGKPKDDRRGQLPSTVSIAGRPVIAEQRGRCGDWEGDTIVNPGKRSGLVSTTDRLSGMLKLNKVKNLKSATVIDKMLEQFESLPPQSRHTLTLDNGKEFAQHERLEHF